MNSIEARAAKASNEMVNVLRNELLNQQYKDVVSRIFVAKFLLTNKHHSFDIPSSLSWRTISTSYREMGNQLDKLFYAIEMQIEEMPYLFRNFSLSQISDQALDKCLMIMDHMSLSEDEFQDFTLTGKYFKALIENVMLRDKKELGTFITPDELNQLMIKVIKPVHGEIYDGTAGIGGSLIEASKFSTDITLYGQEIQETNVSLAYMNAIVNGIDLNKFRMAHGDTLFHPQFLSGAGGLKQFDYIVMNPPFGIKLEDIKLLDYDPYGRFNGRMGKTGKTHGELAFLQHAVASLNENGKAALIIPTGVLSRSSYAEKAFREYIVKSDLIETIVLLPSKLLPSTAIQTVLLVLNKKKLESRKNKIQFINAENLYESKRAQNYLRQEDIDKIVSMYEQFSNNTEDSQVVNDQQIIENDFILNPKHYFSSQTVESEFGDIIINKAVYEEKVKNKKSLKMIAELSRGVNLPPKSVVKEGQKGYKVIQLKDVVDGYIDIENIDLIPVQNTERYTVLPGDIIIASRGTAFKVAIVPEHDDTLILSNMFIRIRILDKSTYLPEYIKTFIESPIGVALIEGMQKGGMVRALTTSDIENIEFPDVASEKQNEIVRTISEAEDKYKNLLKEAQETLKQGKLNAYSKMGISEVIEEVEIK